MKKFFASLLSLGLLSVSCTSSPPTEWDDRSIYEAGLIPSARSILDGLPGASIYHMDITIADDLLSLSGKLDVRYTNTEDVSLTEIYFRLFPNILGGNMRVSDLQIDGSVVNANFDLNNSLMIVPLTGGLRPGESTVVHMVYSVAIPSAVELNYGFLAYADNVLALAHAYPMISVFDDDGWNAEVPPQYGDLTYADASFYRVQITAPKKLTLATSGIVINTAEAGQDQVVTVAAGPARDFYLAASPEYEIVSQNFGEYTIRSFAPARLGQGSQAAVEAAARAMEVFSGRYTSYPYTEFDVVTTPTQALGIEYPGIVAVTSWTYDVGDAATRNYLESTVAHETGHQWFYNLIGNDQLDDPWLDESLTQFITLQYYADEYGPPTEEGFRNTLVSRWARVDFSAIPVGLPVAGYTGPEYTAIIYGRGPLFFVELRKTMGVTAFDLFLREYAETLAWEEATPGILQSIAEKNCSCELDSLFNDWIHPKQDR